MFDPSMKKSPQQIEPPKEKARHTLGPWRVLHRVRIGCGSHSQVTFVQQFSGVTTTDELEANARLIAAAPELLDAARAALAYDAAIHRRGFMGDVSNTDGEREHYATGDDLDALY